MAAYCFGNVTNVQMNWSLCIICQEDTQDALKCPVLSPALSRGDKGVAYESFLANVKSFRDIDALPTKLYFECRWLTCALCILAQIMSLKVQQ